VNKGVTYFRAWRDLKNGGTVALDLCFGITNDGEVLLPTKKLGLTDSEVRELKMIQPDAPVFEENGAFFIGAKYAAYICEDPESIAGLEFLRAHLLSTYARQPE
jgi:hypothetical protein